MKRHLTLTIAILMFLVVVEITAGAQVFGSKQIRAQIPFAFNVGNKTFPAGEYTVRVLNPNSDRCVLQIQSKDGRLSTLIHTTGITANERANAKMVFKRYGDTYFFAQAQMAGDSTTLAAVKSNAQRNHERALASNARKGTVTIDAE